MQIGSARANSIGEIHFITVFSAFVAMKNVSVHTKVSAEVEHRQGTKHFLEDSLDGYTVEVQEVNGILQITVRSCRKIICNFS